jgi:transaldolase
MKDKIRNLKIKIFADGADLNSIKKLNDISYISGFTTNPTLMRKAGVVDYKKFAIDVLKVVKNKPISFEVFADDIKKMEIQAMEIAGWGNNANVKIPITNTKGDSTVELLEKLSNRGVVCNITAIFTLDQLDGVLKVLSSKTPAILSIFAGRIADVGIDPINIMRDSVKLAKIKPKSSILWASTREVINIFQAEEAGCKIITVPHDILKKLTGVGKDLNQSSLETVNMFYQDAKMAGYTIKTKKN